MSNGIFLDEQFREYLETVLTELSSCKAKNLIIVGRLEDGNTYFTSYKCTIDDERILAYDILDDAMFLTLKEHDEDDGL